MSSFKKYKLIFGYHQIILFYWIINTLVHTLFSNAMFLQDISNHASPQFPFVFDIDVFVDCPKKK